MGSLAFFGALAGAGKGIAGIGENMAREEERRLALEEQRRFQQMMQEDRQAETRALVAARNGSGGSGGKASGMSALEMMRHPELIAANGGGISRGMVDDYISMSEGKTPMAPTVEDDSGFSATELPKYTPGQASEVMAKGKAALWEAMKVANPGQADDLAKAQRTDQGTQFAADFRKTGDELAGSAAYVNDGKPAYDDGSSNATGKMVKGSLAEAKAGAEKALANQRNAKAKAEGAPGSGASKVAKTYTNASGEMVAVMRDGTERVLGKSKDYQTMVNAEKKNLLKTMDGASMAPDELEAKAIENVVNRARPSKPAEDKPGGGKTTLTDLPPGAKQIGTSGGKPVYETPDGRRFIRG